MNRIIIILAFVGLLTPAKLNAQKVYLEGTKVVLDLTASTGMPAGAVTSVKKTWPTTGSNTAGPIANNVVSQTINATVYQKIEVAPYDLNSG